MYGFRVVIAGIGLSLLGNSAALADTRIIMQEGTELAGDVSGLPEGMRKAYANQAPTTAVHWYGSDRSATIRDSVTLISRLDRGEIYVVSHPQKSYRVITLDRDDSSDALSGTAELAATSETRTIGSWNATRYDVSVRMAGDEPTEGTLWISGDIEVDLSGYRAVSRATAAALGSSWMLEILEVEGFPVRQEFQMGPIRSWQEAVSIEDASPPAGVYEPPDGYTRSD